MAMRKLHGLADRHTSSITAASGNPLDYIPDTALDEFAELAYTLWGQFLSTAPFVIEQAVIASAVFDATAKYQDLLELLIGKKIYNAPIMGEFITGSIVQYGDIRPLLVALGGGATDPTVQLQGGIGTGQIFIDAARDNGVPIGDEKIWLYGYEEQPRRVFNGHLQMDGIVFTNWNDDGLVVSPQDYWLRVTHYYPGDHYGCSCVVAPYVPNLEEDFTVTLLPSD